MATASATAATAAGEGAAPGAALAEQPRPPRRPSAESSRTPSLPPGPRAHPIVQTLAWAFAPTWLMDACARRGLRRGGGAHGGPARGDLEAAGAGERGDDVARRARAAEPRASGRQVRARAGPPRRGDLRGA